MNFEYDPLKDEINQEKHGVSFEEAQSIWADPNLVTLPARRKGETRKLAIGKSYSALFSVVHTKRGDAIRIISARRTTRKEAAYYARQSNRR